MTGTLERARKYELSVGLVKVDAGEAPRICMRLYDLRNKVGISDQAFAVGGDHSISGLRWTFETPNGDGDYRVIAYAGVPGKCDGVGVSFMDVSVT